MRALTPPRPMLAMLATLATLALAPLGAGPVGCDSSRAATDGPPADIALPLERVATGLENPVLVTAPANDARLFVVEQPGRVRVVKNGQLLATPFLDLTAKVAYGGERGLLGLAFDPAYTSNGRLYVYYTKAGSGDIVVERYAAVPDADVAGAAATSVIRWGTGRT